MLASCSPPAGEREDQSAKIQQLERDVATRDAQIAELKELLLKERLEQRQQVTAAVVDKRMGDRSAANEAQAEPAIPPTPSRYPNMCYKDYCPCEGAQGGPDEILCDQLEQGVDPAVDLMIAARKMRQARQ